MAQIRYTKTELRAQQMRLLQLNKYLPTLQLKKMMLQLEINQVIYEIENLVTQKEDYESEIDGYRQLFTDADADPLFQTVEVLSVEKRFENIAGVEIPIFEKVIFHKPTYFLFDTPFWLESAIHGVQNLISVREHISTLEQKRALLEKELREVSIRVNLFEKIMIPRTEGNIKKIKIFLGDLQLAAVSQAKASKRKILQRKEKK